MALDDRGPELVAATVILLVSCVVTGGLRCYVRLSLLKVFKIEDYLSIATLVAHILFSACVLTSVKYGAGKHIQELTPDQIVNAVKAKYFGELAWVVTSILLKFTVGIFLLRICSLAWQKRVIYVVLAVILFFNSAYLFLAMFQCKPVEYFWLRVTKTAQGQCLDNAVITGFTFAATALNGWADWTLGLLPVALVWKLELNGRTKASVAGILALGIVASAGTIIRIPYVWQLTHDEDILYVFTEFTIWSTVENGLGLTASSIATLRPLFKHLLHVRSTGRGVYPLERPSTKTAFNRLSNTLPSPAGGAGGGAGGGGGGGTKAGGERQAQRVQIGTAKRATVVQLRAQGPDVDSDLESATTSDEASLTRGKGETEAETEAEDRIERWKITSRFSPVSVRRMDS